MAQGNGNGRSALVDRCKALITEAYQEATEMIVAYLELHPDEPRNTLCREIDPDNWSALSKRVERMQEKRRSERLSGATTSPIRPMGTRAKGEFRAAPKEVKEAIIAEALADPDVRKAVEVEIAKDDHSVRRVVTEQAKRHDPAPREHVPSPRPSIDYDEQFQDAGATVVYRMTDWQQGKWTPNERSQFVLHFLRRAVNDPTPAEAEALVDEITSYLEGVNQ